MTEKNVPLLLATMAMIKVFPENHDQGAWIDPCNTTMCFAGHAATIAGATFNPQAWRGSEEWILDPNGKHVRNSEAEYSDGTLKEGYKYVEDYASNKLGLTPVEAAYMFHHGRTRKQLEYAVGKFAEGYTVTYEGHFVKKVEES